MALPRLSANASEGRKVAKAKGVKFGRRPKLTAHQGTEALRRLDEGDSARAIRRDFNVSHLTVLKVQEASR